jgi:cation diffusion facilitator CzcD-associated flavoprotein CzcO
MASEIDVAIIGAGPYGLSIAAHLAKLGVEHRVIGAPMFNWLHHMPKGMMLKSEGFASDLYDPDRLLPLREYCIERGIEYADLGFPMPLETFVAYGLAFQKQFAPQVENKALVRLEQAPEKFRLLLDNGEEFCARRVVIATGVMPFKYIPAELAHLPSEFLTHSSEHRNLEQFKGREVTVIGAGASAIELATLLHEGGADVMLVARAPRIEIDTKMRLPRPLSDRLLRPVTGAGLSWRSLLYANAPQIVHFLPEKLRLRIVKRHLGPAGGYFLKERFSSVPHLSGYRVRGAKIVNHRAELTLKGRDGSVRQIATQHIIAGTGFRVDLRRLSFLSSAILGQLTSVEYTPVLSSHFQSSVAGLFFVGPVSANSFGPVMRFAFGAKFTAPRIAMALAKTSGAQGQVTRSAPHPRSELSTSDT